MKLKYPIGLKDGNGTPMVKEIEGEISFKTKVDLENHNFGTSLADTWRAEDIGVSELMAKNEIEKRVLNWDKLVEALKFYADPDCYEKFGSYNLSEIDEDGGEWAQKVLEEIGKCGL